MSWRKDWAAAFDRYLAEEFHAQARTMDRAAAEGRCWACGVEPVRMVEVTTMCEAEPRYLPVWPSSTDHVHDVRPPTPAELEQAGHEALSRIQREATTP